MYHDVLSPEGLLEEAAEPYIGLEKDIIITCEGRGIDPILKRQAELLYAFKNYIDNAVDFAKSRVELSAHWDVENFTIYVDDDGEGFNPSLKGHLGQPYASARNRSQTAAGLGLGLFISGRLIERTGGIVRYRKSPLGGARIETQWPRGKLSVKSSE